MKRVVGAFAFIVLLFSFSSCKKDKDPGLSSADGTWTYTTPDNKVSITFELVKSSTGATYDVKNAKITVDGTVASDTFTQPDNLSAPTFSTLGFNANDAKLIYDYRITFTNATISDDFTKIEVSTAEYTFPWGTSNKLSNIVIVRS
jgi:hypothetical protein